MAADGSHMSGCKARSYIRMRSGFLYLVAIMDWHSRKVLAWRLSNSMEADLCVSAEPRRRRSSQAATTPRRSAASRPVSSAGNSLALRIAIPPALPPRQAKVSGPNGGLHHVGPIRVWTSEHWTKYTWARASQCRGYPCTDWHPAGGLGSNGITPYLGRQPVQRKGATSQLRGFPR